MNKGLQIVLSSHDFSFQAIKESDYAIDCPYRGNPLLLRLIREIWFRLQLPGKSLWYNARLVGSADCYIVYDALITVDFMRWLRKVNPTSRIIYNYTNPVSKAISPEELPDELCEKWSSDPEDCKKYHLRQIQPGGYFRHWKVEKRSPECDIFYIGRDKGRLDKLLELKDTFEGIGLKTNFYITAYHRQQRFNKPIYKPLVPYSEVLEMLGGTRAILHTVDNGQTGITIRVMEAMIHQIKLITDNSFIKDTIAYHPDNVFILGEDKIEELPEFLNRPFVPYTDKIIESLSYERAIGRIVDQG